MRVLGCIEVFVRVLTKRGYVHVYIYESALKRLINMCMCLGVLDSLREDICEIA